MGRDLERDTAAAARLETLAERLRSIASVARERKRSIEGRLAGAVERRGDLEAEQADLTKDIEAAALAEEAGAARLLSLDEALVALEDEESALAEQLGLSAEGLVANLRGDLRGSRSGADRDEKGARRCRTEA